MATNELLLKDNDITKVAYPGFEEGASRHRDDYEHFNAAILELIQRLEVIDLDKIPVAYRRICAFSGSLSTTFSQENLYRLLKLSDKGLKVQILLFDPFSDVSPAFSTREYALNLANQDVLGINEALINRRKNMPRETLYEKRNQLSSQIFLYEQLETLKQHLKHSKCGIEIRYTHVKTESPTFIIGDQVLKGHFFYNNDPDNFPWICSLQDSNFLGDISSYFAAHFDKLWDNSHALYPPKRNVFIGYDRDMGTLCRLKESLSRHYLFPLLFKADDWQEQHIINIVRQHQKYANGAAFIMCNPNGDGQARSNVVAEFDSWCQLCESNEGWEKRLYSKTLLILEKGVALSNWNLDDLEASHDVSIVRFSRNAYGNPDEDDWDKVEKAIVKLKKRVHGW